MNKIRKENSGSIIALIGAIISYFSGIYYIIYGAQVEAALNRFGETLESMGHSMALFLITAGITFLFASLVVIGAILPLKTNIALGGGILCIIIGIVVLYFVIIDPGVILDLTPPLSYDPPVKKVGSMVLIDPILMIIGGALIIYYRKQF
ncbi:MAG: hypothetical protein ACFFAS_05000 [Promethearchaeota archaeon]